MSSNDPMRSDCPVCGGVVSDGFKREVPDTVPNAEIGRLFGEYDRGQSTTDLVKWHEAYRASGRQFVLGHDGSFVEVAL